MEQKNTATVKIIELPNPPVGMSRIMPHLFYQDVEAAVNWLVEAFSFKVRKRMIDKNGLVVHASLEVGDSLIMLGLVEEHSHWESPETIDGKICSRLFIYVEDVEAHYKQAKLSGAKINIEIGDRWFGERVYEAIDHEGHYWKFAQPIFLVDEQKLQRP